MNIIKFTETLKVKLTYFQLDMLELLEKDPDAWQPKMEPKTPEMRQLLNVYSQWKEHQNSLVAC